jgi:hypothetical protein
LYITVTYNVRPIGLGHGKAREMYTVESKVAQALLGFVALAGLHGLASHLVDALIVGTVEDVWLVGRVNHADMAQVVDEEASLC